MRRRLARVFVEPVQYTDELAPVSLPVLVSRRDELYPYLCPTCGKEHWVNAARHNLAYGRQLTCGYDCESQKRKQWRLRWNGGVR